MKKYLLILIPIIFLIGFYFTTNHKFGGAQNGKVWLYSDHILPNPQLTPGVINPQVNQSNIQSTICKSGWTATIRPASSYTTQLKLIQLGQGTQLKNTTGKAIEITSLTWGYYAINADYNPTHYEEDHLISLELGGHPTDPKNLWPEKYPEARQKDQVEHYLKRQVCSGEITLKEAQKIISTDWTKVKAVGNYFGSINDISDTDD